METAGVDSFQTFSNNQKRSNGPTPQSVKLGPPPRWFKCPRKGQISAGKFVPFKTPLCTLYNDGVPEQYRFTPDMLFSSVKNMNKIGLWIDLTNTDRFYTKEEVEAHGAKYVKFQCRGHGECPSVSQADAFCVLCKAFISQHPNELIAVHCTHGFNRTGFLICAYLVTEMGWSIDAAASSFAQIRPPGIYKQDYLRELFTRYGDVDDTPTAPALPDWCDESEPILNDDEAEALASSSSRPAVGKVPQFSPSIAGVTPVMPPAKARPLQQKCSSMCGWKKKGFPGSQPVSMDLDNLKFLAEKLYRVSWKADGIRYMMLIDGPGEVYMFDRDHNVFHVAGLRFPRPRELDKHIRNTLLEGEMVIDKVEGKDCPRYLIYDVVHYEKNDPSAVDVGKLDFYKRLSCVERNIIGARNEAMKQGKIIREKEPFSVRIKQFFDITAAEKLLSEDFKKQLAHECDGLVFQNVPDPYMPGRSDYVLKWKPHHLNSVDFKLVVNYESKEGMIPEYVGFLFVLGLDQPFSIIKPLTKDLKALDKKIIECSWEKGRWKFLRERTDKSFPNSFQTASGVCKSIVSPVTTEILLNFIKQHAKKPHSAVALPSQNTTVTHLQSESVETRLNGTAEEESFKHPDVLPHTANKRLKT